MYTDLLNFLRDEECFIEAEAKPTRMRNFIDNYNTKYGENLLITDGGLILLQENADKRGLELRLYVRNCPPPNIKSLGFARNNAYRNEFGYRINSNRIVEYLFDHGYRIGMNY